MSRYISTVILAVIMTVQVFAQQKWVPFLQQTETAPSATLSSSDNKNVSFIIRINGMSVTDVTVGETKYQKVSIPRAETMTKQSLPQVPMITKLIAIPDCDDVSISVAYSNMLEFKYNVLPIPRIEKKKRQDGSESYSEVFEEDKSVYSSNADYPGKYGEILEVGYVRGQKVARVAIYPIQFNPVGKIVHAFTDFNVSLMFTNSSSSVNKELGIFRNMMNHAAMNYNLSGLSASSKMNDTIQPAKLSKLSSISNIMSGSVNRVTNLSTLVGPNAMPVDYLIITHSSLFNSSSLTTLANQRCNLNGYDVAIVHVNDMNGPPPNYDCVYEYYSRPTHYQSVRDFISAVYTNGKANHTGDGHLGYILLVGDALQDNNSTEMLPAAYPTYYGSDEQAGDYYYACTGGDSDDLLDVMYGRLSVGNETELSNNVNKIISYESNSNGSWCDKATLVNGCQDEYNHADPKMKQLTEIIPPTTPKYYAYRKLDTDPSSVVTEAQLFGQQFTAAQYADPAYLCGADLLDSWVYNDANAGINHRIHTWIYEGHGDPFFLIDEGCGRYILRVTDCTGNNKTIFTQLNNDLYPFIIFNCCSTGYLDYTSGDCMAEAFMNIANKGAIGVLASTRESDASGYGVTDGTVLNAMYCSLSHIMGEAVMESKLNISQMYRRQFNLYGDPAVNLWPVGGYTVTENLILSGTVQISNNITVAPGVYLDIRPNTTLRFVNGTSLIVNGTLTTEGYSSNMITFDFISPNSSTQNGIKFNSSSSNSELLYCNIKNAYTGVYCNGSNTLPVINNCVISNNTIGIRLNGVQGSNKQFLNNKITNNSYYGIELYSSSPTNMYNDTISYNGYYGVLCESGSSPYLTYNIIKNQSTGAGIFCNGASPHLNSYSGDLVKSLTLCKNN